MKSFPEKISQLENEIEELLDEEDSSEIRSALRKVEKAREHLEHDHSTRLEEIANRGDRVWLKRFEDEDRMGTEVLEVSFEMIESVGNNLEYPDEEIEVLESE